VDFNSLRVQVARYYDAAVAAGADAVQAANWVVRDIMQWCKDSGVRAALVPLLSRLSVRHVVV
jgi:Asp-tRNA(Asn)/Glu-tRNA(Gln) amidotransferase B subunit